jgi:hypothetical protein
MFFLYQHCAALHRQAIWCKSQLSLDLDTFLVLFSFLQNLCKIWCSGRQVDTIELPSGSMQPRSPSTHRFCLNFINLELNIYCICTSSTNFEGLLNIGRTAPFVWGITLIIFTLTTDIYLLCLWSTEDLLQELSVNIWDHCQLDISTVYTIWESDHLIQLIQYSEINIKVFKYTSLETETSKSSYSTFWSILMLSTHNLTWQGHISKFSL